MVTKQGNEDYLYVLDPQSFWLGGPAEVRRGNSSLWVTGGYAQVFTALLCDRRVSISGHRLHQGA